MNLNECRQLIKKSLLGNLPRAIQTQLSISEKMVNQLSQQLVAADIPYENVEWLLIPRLRTTIFKICNTGEPFQLQALTRQITKMISEENLQDPVPVAVKSSKNESVMQRRIDSLSRILSVHSRVSSCVAVALIKGRLLVATNTPISRDVFQEKIGVKLTFLRKFLKEVTPSNLILGEEDAIKLTLRCDLAAFEAADDLIQAGTGVIRSEKYSREERLKVDIMKIARSYLEGLGTQGKRGFNLLQIKSLMNANPVFLFPKAEIEAETGLTVHAEQLLFLQVKALKEQGIISNAELPVSLGISKLACQACESVLGSYQTVVTYRGGSNIGFPKVADIRTGKEHKPRITIGPKTNFIPIDSDSDVGLERYESAQTQPMTASNSSLKYYSVFKAPKHAERGVNQPPAIKLKS